jgi:hypothetical protein
MSGGSSANFYGDIAYNNAAAWMSPPHSVANTGSKAYENNYVLLNGSASGSYNNTSLGTATQATEAAEYTTWQAKLVSNSVTVGPVTLAPQTVATTPLPPPKLTPPPADPTSPPSVPTPAPAPSNPTSPVTGSTAGSGSNSSSASGSSTTTPSNPPTTTTSGLTYHRRRRHHL